MSEIKETLYPIITQDKVNELIEQKASKSINEERLKQINIHVDSLNEKLSRYMKVKKRYTKADNIVKGSLASLALITTIVSIVVGSLTPLGVIPNTIGIIVSASFGSLSVIEGIVGKVISHNFTSKRKKNFQERINIVNEYLNKIYIYVDKIKRDGIISQSEFEDFFLLINQFNERLNELKLSQNMRKKVGNQIQLDNSKNISGIGYVKKEDSVDDSYNLLDDTDKAIIHENVKYTLKTQQLEDYKKKLLETKKIP